MKQMLKYRSAKDAPMMRTVNRQRARTYNNSLPGDGVDHLGPSRQDLLLDFSSPISSRWNQDVIEFIIHRIQRRIQTKTQLPQRTDDYFRARITSAMKPLFQNKNLTRRRVLSDGEDETDQHIVERIVVQFDQGDLESRRRSRRNRVRESVSPPFFLLSHKIFPETKNPPADHRVPDRSRR